MRLRLLPVVMFALAATVTIKVGTVWNAVDVSVGSHSLAQGEPAAQPEAPAAPLPAQQSAAKEQPAAGPTESADPAATANTAQTDAQPAPAPAEGTAGEAPAGEALPEETEVHDPFNYTDEEVDVLQQLAKRREELDLRARQLDEREALVQAAEQRMDQKMAELKALQAVLEDLLKQRSDEEEAELKSLVKMYENMKPKDAAQVFEEMDMDVLLDVVGRMNERKAAPILALVTPTRAKEITFELAQRRALPLPE